MKIKFIDAENVGISHIKTLAESIEDKVLVFSRQDKVIQYCQHRRYVCISHYPAGSNQADFYIVSHLSRILSNLSDKHRASIQMEIHTNDAALILAFESICGEFECTSSSIQTLVKKGVKPEPPKAAPVIQLKATPADKLYAALQQPQRFNPELQQRLKLSKSDFTKAVNELIKSGKIKRSSTKKTWVRAQVA